MLVKEFSVQLWGRGWTECRNLRTETEELLGKAR